MKTATLVLIFSSILHAASEFSYPTGAFRKYKNSQCQSRALETELQSLSKRWFGNELELKELRRLEDREHLHLRYAFLLRGGELLEHSFDVHFSKKKNCIESASSTLSLYPEKIPEASPYYFIHNDEWVPAKVKKTFAKNPFRNRHWIEHGKTGEILDVKQAFRAVTNAIYPTNPARSGTEVVTLPNLSGTTLLDDSNTLHVKREQDADNPESIEVSPSTLYVSEAGFSELESDPAENYDSDCDDSSTTACPNAAFDAVNIYYHMRTFRSAMNLNLDLLDASPTFSLDPLTVFTNTLSLEIDDTNLTPTEKVSSAFYFPETEDSEGNARSGIFFFAPPQSESEACGGEFDNHGMAREALYVVHEYQHYLTQFITGIVKSSQSTRLAADLWHEAYSDYFAASHISALVNQEITKFGEFSFQDCTDFQRDIGTIKAFGTGNDEADPANNFADPHVGGGALASGLWALRESLGKQRTDVLVLKSLFFLSTQPSVVEGVEALVSADETLNSGENVATIRDIFYSQVQVLPNAFSSDGEVNIGFSSCLATPKGTRSFSSLVWFLLVPLLIIGARKVGCAR